MNVPDVQAWQFVHVEVILLAHSEGILDPLVHELQDEHATEVFIWHAAGVVEVTPDVPQHSLQVIDCFVWHSGRLVQ